MAEFPTLVDPPIEQLLDAVGGSKFTLVAVASVRARAITNYFNGLGRGDGKIEPPQVTIDSNKSLSFAQSDFVRTICTHSRTRGNDVNSISSDLRIPSSIISVHKSGSSPLKSSDSDTTLSASRTTRSTSTTCARFTVPSDTRARH